MEGEDGGGLMGGGCRMEDAWVEGVGWRVHGLRV